MGPFIGQTYSLYGCEGAKSTADYYRTIKKLTDLCLRTYGENDEKKLLAILREAGKSKNLLHRLFRKTGGSKYFTNLKEALKIMLANYTKGAADHLKHLSIPKRFDSTLRTGEDQYHLYMVEIELVNRIYMESFKQCEYKFALLPHCLSDFRLKCLSAPGDMEHVCKSCTKECYIHRASQILKKYRVNPYISMTIDQDKILKEVKEKYRGVGVFGIACVPELARGMRLAISLDIPPIGVPLDANRCSRWMDKAYENSLNLKELENLLK
jgi:hypothetical protein